MVSAEYPYVQEIFSTNIFDKIKWVFTSQCKDWEASEREGFEKIMIFYMFGFGVYMHMGRDFDYIFDVIPEDPEKLTLDPEYRTSFILDVVYLMSIYRMFKVFIYSLGLPEQHYNTILANIELTKFIPLLYSHILADYLMNLDNKETKLSRAYAYDLLSLVNDCNTNHKEIEKMFNNLEKKFTFTYEMWIHLHLANISSWLIFLDGSDNQDVKEAVQAMKKAEANKEKYQKRVLKRARR
jgi:hypothetical protein